MTEKIKKLRQNLVSIVPEISIDRARSITQSYKETEGETIYIRRAKALKNILTKMPIYIEDGQLIAGNQAHKPRSAPIFPEYAWDWILNELDDLEKRSSDRFIVHEEDKQEIRKILQYWKGRTVKDRALATQPEIVKEGTKMGVVEWEGNVTAGEGHITVDFEMALNKGFQGIIEEAKKKLDEFDLIEPENLKKRYFLEAVKMVLEASIEFGKRYARLATELAEKEKNNRRKIELERISNICERIPLYPPKDFHEAIQMVWFIQLILQIESNGHSISLGRVDQYLYPFYEKDIKEKKLTKEKVIELIECFYLKIFIINKVRPWSHTQVVAGYPTYQNLCIGGQTPDGKDATNELSYLFLDALAEIRLSEPNFYVRYHRNCPEDLLLRCCEIIKMGFGMPALVNDKVIVPSLLNRGVKLEDALNYATMGCLEVSVPGKWGYRANGKIKFNLLKVLELSINNGKDPNTGITLCPGNGDLENFNSFREVMEAWKKQLEYYTKLHIIADNTNSLALEELTPDIFCSTLVQDCIGRGKPVSEGGAIYDMQSGTQIGLANVGNSLAAIKKLVFEDKKISGKELKKALERNFEGIEGEKIRQILINWAPKYGNDDDYVDLLAKEAYDYYCTEIHKYKNTRYGKGPIGGNWMPSTVTISSNVPAGKVIEATPDGRKAKEPTADGVSPMHGTEKRGPTGVIKSVSKLSTLLMTGGQLLNMRISPSALVDSDDLKKFAALIRTFFRLYGWHVQFNTISTDILKDAQKHPEKYTDLVVRVAGYSALFIALDPDVQEDIIGRMEYELT